MGTRIATAFILIPPVLVLLWFNPGGVAVFLLLVLLLVGLFWEYGKLANARGAAIGPFEIGALSLVSIFWMAPPGLWRIWPEAGRLEPMAGFGFLLLALVAFVSPVLRGRTEGAIIHAAAVVFSGVYLGWVFGLHAVLLYDRHTVRWLFVLLGAIWACDSGAYFVGRAIGKHPFAPRVSPKKTWEGTVGGLVAAVGATFVLVDALLPEAKALALGAGLLIGTVGQLSDLAESALKRDAGVKDSGGWIPGHGGLLDRLDSLIFATPVLYYYLRLVTM